MNAAEQYGRTGFIQIGTGVVVRDMEPGDIRCFVFLNETDLTSSPNVFGGEDTDEEQVDTLTGVSTKIQGKQRAAIGAYWLPGACGALITPPTLAKGSVVMVYKKAYEDKFYWQQWGMLAQSAKRYVGLWYFPNKPEEPGADELDPSNEKFNKTYTADYWNASWKAEINTHAGLVHFSTTMTNKEFTDWVFNLDVKEGNLQILDGTGNGFEIFAKPKTMRLRSTSELCFRVGGSINAMVEKGFNLFLKEALMSRIGGAAVIEILGETVLNGTKVTLDLETLNALINDAVNAKVKGNIALQNEGDVSIASNGEIKLTTPGALSIAAVGGSTIVSPTFAVNGVVAAAGLSLGGGGGSAPTPTIPTIERPDIAILDDIADYVWEMNKLQEEEKEDEEEEEKEERKDVEDPEDKQPEESEQNMKGEITGEINLKANGAVSISGMQGLALKGGPNEDNLLEVIGNLAVEIAKICQTLVTPNNVIGVAPLGPIVAGCVPAAASHISSVTEAVTKLKLIGGTAKSIRRRRSIVNQYIDTLSQVQEEINEALNRQQVEVYNNKPLVSKTNSHDKKLIMEIPL